MGGAAPRSGTPTLQVEWIYMTFDKTGRVEYVRSGRKLREP